jgi:predicted HTH domain antitoxin
MSEEKLEVPDGALDVLLLTPQVLSQELRLAAAIKLYDLGRLSSGIAADLAGVPRVVFLSKLGEFRVDTFRLSEEELRREASFA